MSNSLLLVHVSVRVTPESKDAFARATLENAEHSRREPGVLRFDVLEDRDDPTRFLLVEVYRDAQAQAAHKETAHYARWREAVGGMMAEPRASHRYLNRSPDDERW